MIFLKTYVYAPWEHSYINAQLQECYDVIDCFLIYEFSKTHQGGPKEKTFDLEKILPQYRDKIYYKFFDDLKFLSYEDYGDKACRLNEHKMRSSHTLDKDIEIFSDDIVVSVDADEIIYSNCWQEIIQKTKENGTINFRLNQFFFKPNYLWKDCNFIAPTAAVYGKYNGDGAWRYNGYKITDPEPGYGLGAHLSWCMEPEEMLLKLNSYSHPNFNNFSLDELQKAVQDKKYIFDFERDFTIQELDWSSKLIPKFFQQ